MGLSLNFYLSATALLAGIGGGIYFLTEWLWHNRTYKFLLFWAIGLFCLFIFQIPTILTNAGRHLVLTDFNKFFSIIIPISFLALVSIYLGILSLVKPVRKKVYISFTIWIIASLAYFGFYFWENNVFTSRIPLYGMIILFFLPIHILNLIAVSRLWAITASGKSVSYKTGLIFIVFALFCGLARNALFLYGFSVYPPAFWYLALQYPELFWLQILGIIGVLTGFLLIHKTCLEDRRVSLSL
ncbi:MAG: hypothetical protein KGJ89_00110 [Patescibacteria group bacterium]|nr:hypothetical protein [Patescibacteria group bacterium]MDE2014924.1 hypothetical protein [Patescibacteria group bacterium]MDE2226353.1 hypothetical protein [Patescibacteria group bacterium]